MKEFINNEQNPINSISQLSKEHYNKFFYYKCEKCNSIKSKRFYQYLKNDLMCRECKYKETSCSKYGGKNPGFIVMHKKMIEKYGTTSTSQFIDYSKIDYTKTVEKAKQTKKEKYGNENYNNTKKREKTCLEKYGFTCPAKNDKIKNKQRNTLKERYGNDLPGPRASHQKFLKQRQIETEKLDLEWIDKDNFRGKYDNGPIYYNFKCNICGNIFKDDFHSGIPVCRICNPNWSNSSRAEKEIVKFLKTFYNGKIIENDRTVLSGKELDIYLPENKIAIEYNGTYWHGYRKDTTLSLSEFKKRIEEKRLLCEQKDIRLITIDEADYNERKDIINNFLKDTISPRKRIYARQCDFKEINEKDAKSFLETYHVNGYRGGYYKCGLYYNSELIVVAIFSKHKKYENECVRLCYKTGYDVIGGWAKIQKHFGKPFLHYVNLKYFRGENKTGCGYRCFLHKHLYSRQQLQRKTLSKYIDSVDESLSDFQNVLNANGIMIYDLGNDIRIYNTDIDYK